MRYDASASISAPPAAVWVLHWPAPCASPGVVAAAVVRGLIPAQVQPEGLAEPLAVGVVAAGRWTMSEHL